jgi:uncharacterized membrane protein YfcA
MSNWDIALLIVVSIQATLTAYVREPRAKALLVTFPFPFSVAFLSLGKPVDATNVLGLALLLLFTHAVRWLHARWNWPIVAAIAGAACLYGVLGGLIARALPREDWTFWAACAVVFVLGAALLVFQPHRDEPGHRSPLPVTVKLPIVMAVVAGLIASKQWLQGFMTVFPMVTVIAAYEARHSLWTLTRQIPVVMLTLGALMVALRLAQPRAGSVGALAIGWLVFACALPVAQGLRDRPRRGKVAAQALAAPGLVTPEAASSGPGLAHPAE